MKNVSKVLIFVGTFLGCHAVTDGALVTGLVVCAFGLALYLALKFNEKNLQK